MEYNYDISILGNVYGRWTIVEELNKKKHKQIQVTAQCGCGVKREMAKYLFLSGNNSYQCNRCNLKEQKRIGMCCTKLSHK